MSSKINGIQMNNRLGMDMSMMFGHIQGNDFTPDAGKMVTTSNDMSLRQFRLAFQDSKTENVPHENKNIITDNNVGKRLDIYR